MTAGPVRAAAAARHRPVRARDAFLRACELDVRVRKPGNVSLASAGHGMQAEMFIQSSQAAADALFCAGARVGPRVEGAQAASWRVAGCNTNLGIVLLCAPIAAAVDGLAGDGGWIQPLAPALLRRRIETVLADLDVDDARAAFRAISNANPGGLGAAPSQDVHDAPSIDLRAAMALAAERDRIARQYRDDFADLFQLALPALGLFWQGVAGLGGQALDARTVQAVQRLYVTLLASLPDSHIVRKHGEAVAQTVMRSAQAWRARAEAGAALDADPAFADWDAQLKSDGLNPGTTADLTVATLVLAGLTAGPPEGAGS
jgi:triphosphoribosyl-dephospho-CoA synthase